mmetsp:Transcript_2503/g.7353  ORF Transcript_2503/g.7353 Transcript_2503/m.7353 type:complete len:169 (-) Transcript_2503:10-516(-)
MKRAGSEEAEREKKAQRRETWAEPACLESVEQFHRCFSCPVVASPALPVEARSQLRLSLLQEELDELRAAVGAGDLVEVADALADLQYVLSGTVHEFGCGGVFKELFDEVHRSNMTKLCETEEDAKATVAHYLKRDGTEAAYRPSQGKYLVFRKSDNKTLKCVKYSPA